MEEKIQIFEPKENERIKVNRVKSTNPNIKCEKKVEKKFQNKNAVQLQKTINNIHNMQNIQKISEKNSKENLRNNSKKNTLKNTKIELAPTSKISNLMENINKEIFVLDDLIKNYEAEINAIKEELHICSSK